MRISDWSSDVCSSDLVGRDEPPVRRRRVEPSRRLPFADALDRITLQHPGQDRGPGRVGRHEHPQLPRDDLVQQAIGAQAVPHSTGESPQLHAITATYPNAADRKSEVYGTSGFGPYMSVGGASI